MNFQEAQERLAALNASLQQGRITREQYAAGVAQLRVRDSQGTWWQPDPGGRGWIFWDGAAWRPGIPPELVRAPPPPPPGPAGEGLMDLGTFRQISRTVPLAQRPQKWWDLLSILGGIVAAAIWIVYSGMNPTGGGFDLVTVFLMVGLPVALVWFREPIDQFLLPLQPTRRKVPRPMLIGAGLVAPFLTAFILYNVFSVANYPLIQWNLVLGTMCSYALVRDPVVPAGARPPGTRGRGPLVALVVLAALLAAPVLADDCARDPTRAEDCLRTPGYAELIAGTAAAGLSVLVNGPIIIQAVAAGAGGGAAGAQVPPPTGYLDDGRPYWGTGTSTDHYRDTPPPVFTFPAGPPPAGVPPQAPQPPPVSPPPAQPQPPGPQHGETMTIKDYRGQDMDVTYDSSTGKWKTEYGTEVDLDRLDKARKDYVSDTDWSRQEHGRMIEKAAEEAAKSFEPPPKPPKSEATKKFEKWYKDYLNKKQDFDLKDRDIHLERANLWDKLTKAAEKTQKVADYSIDALANVTGPMGKQIRMIYKAGKAYGGNLSQEYAKGGSLLRGAIKGTIKGTVDFGIELGWDKLKQKGIERLSTTRLKDVPPFIKFPSHDISDIPIKEILYKLEQNGAKIGAGIPLDRDGILLGQTFADGTKKTLQDWTLKWIIKDPLKEKSMKLLDEGLDSIIGK